MSRKRKLVLSEILAALDFSDQDSDGLPEIEIEKPEESEEDEVIQYRSHLRWFFTLVPLDKNSSCDISVTGILLG